MIDNWGRVFMWESILKTPCLLVPDMAAGGFGKETEW